MPGEAHLSFHRERFKTRLSRQHLYTQGHCWLRRAEDAWQVGFTKFALRMLGDPVELDFEVAVGSRVEIGDVVGWVEGFKAVSDVFAPLAGAFTGGNPALDEDIDLIRSSPHDRGWLFGVDGEPGPDCLEAEDYARVLNATIDRMLGEETRALGKETEA